MSTTDRELLELAAKAIGAVITGWAETTCGEKAFASGDCESLWNPLTDDGDALRLAVRLGISLNLENKDYPDALAATRRAIVRAAAEIGKEMK